MKKSTTNSLLVIIVLVVVVTAVAIKFGLPYLQNVKQNKSSSSQVKTSKLVSSLKSSSTSQHSSSQVSMNSDSTSSLSSASSAEAFNQKQAQTGIDVSALTTDQCILWAVSERYSYQNADEQSWDAVRNSLDSARIIPYNESSDGFVHIQFNYGSIPCNYYIDSDYNLKNEQGDTVSHYPTEFVNQKANDYLLNR